LTATRQVRELEAGTGGHVPIIAVTASATEEEESACRDAGMDGFVVKPVSKAALVAALRVYVPCTL
jgi:CheY-like chemotaxis protein